MRDDRDWNAISYALFGSIFICHGSWIAYQCPNDGQTGVVVFPLYFLGGVMGIGAISICRRYDVRWYTWTVVVLSAVVAVGSIVLAILSI